MASPVDTSVKFFTDEMVGASVLSGTAGALISVLDSCLVTGFGVRSATSLVVSGGIATLTFTGGTHAAQPQSVIQVSGVTDLTDLNGEQKVLTASSSAITFATALPDGTASGTISFKMAPLGWTKVYSGTNKAVYKPSAPEASSALLRVDDTGTTSARVRMYETMTDVDTGTNPSPPDSRISGGVYWWKSITASAGAVRWTLVGDGRNFYFAPVPFSGGGPTIWAATVHTFGDLRPYKSGDPYCACLVGDTAAPNSSNATGNVFTVSGSGESTTLLRAHHGIGLSVSATRRSMVSGGNSGADSTFGPFPSPANNGLFLSEIVVSQGAMSNNGPRGIAPGALYVPQGSTNNGLFGRGAIVDGTGAFSGRKIFNVPQSGSSLSTTSSDFAAFFDITGPWRT